MKFANVSVVLLLALGLAGVAGVAGLVRACHSAHEVEAPAAPDDFLVSSDPDIKVPVDEKHALVDRGGNDRACDVGCLVLAQREATAATKALGPDAGPEAGIEATKPTLAKLPGCWDRCKAGPAVRW
jgi:hypothetical protein